MSVHGEYSRALEAMLDRLKALDHPSTERWIEDFRGARVGSHPDLSAAARAARRALALLEADDVAGSVEGLVDPRERLEAHCQSILGGPSGE